MTLLKHELKINLKTLIIWTSCVGLICLGCILLFDSIEESMEEMAGMFSQMGAFSEALGMDKVSISTLKGYYATEIALMYAIGGGMFAAMTGACMLAKEEEGHTAEFLNTLPFGRNYIVCWKYGAMAALTILYNVLCIVWALMGLLGAGENVFSKDFFLKDFVYFHSAQLLMHLEVGSVCFLMSSFSRKKQVGAALGFVMLLYGMDLMCRILPDIENLKYVTPYYFSNGADIFAQGSVNNVMIGIGILVIAVSAVLAVFIYQNKDLS